MGDKKPTKVELINYTWKLRYELLCERYQKANILSQLYQGRFRDVLPNYEREKQHEEDKANILAQMAKILPSRPITISQEEFKNLKESGFDFHECTCRKSSTKTDK